MYGYGYSLYNRTPFLGVSGVDPAASAYFAATGITGATQQAAINNLVKGLKSDGLWSKMKAVYPFVTDNRNLLGYTEDFSNAAWLKFNTTVTTNSITAPNGTLTADTITHSSTSADIWQLFSGGAGFYTYTIYVKYNNVQWVRPFIGASGNAVVVWFDIQNGVVGSDGAAGSSTLVSKSIENVGSGWYRLNITVNLTSTSGNYFQINTAQADGNSTRQIGSFYAWGAQLELGSTATTYQPIATTQQAFISSQFKYNLVNPVDSDAAFRLVFNGGWTHSANGATPNGTNGYADTKFVPNANGITTSNAHISFYSRNTNVNGSFPVDMGVDQSSTQSFNVSQKMSDVSALSYHGRAFTQLLTGVDTNNIAGLHTVTRTSTTSLKYNRNGNIIQTNSVLETGSIPTLAIFVGSTNNNGTASLFSTRQAAFSTIGDGLTDTEAANLYTRVQAFQTALSRQV